MIKLYYDTILILIKQIKSEKKIIELISYFSNEKYFPFGSVDIAKYLLDNFNHPLIRVEAYKILNLLKAHNELFYYLLKNEGFESAIEFLKSSFEESNYNYNQVKKVLIEYLTNTARSFIFSTSLPPVNIAFTKWILEEKLPDTYEKRMNLLSLGKKMGGESHIIPVVVGENEETIQLCKNLFENGYFTLPIRTPTVPKGTSRVRLSLCADMTEKDLEKLRIILKDFSNFIQFFTFALESECPKYCLI